ncbi:MAG TPA: tetratricopeptide repeat protein [Bryobacteraceae bacterium]|nr:tetratricopeptide repeat protein [Bryobacteraceae bacterium]
MTPLLLLFLQSSAYQSGVQAYTEHRYADAIPFFETAAAGGPQALVAQFMLGNACLQTHQDEKAVRAFALLFQVGPDAAAARLLTAGMMLRAKLPGAVTEAGRSLEIDPHIPQARFILGEAALSAGDDGKAVEELRKEIAANPDFFMAYYRLGAAYENRSAWDDAISALQRAIWLNPNHNGPYALIGKAYLKRGDIGDAAGALRHALQMDPQDQAIRQLLDQASAPSPAPSRQPPAPGPQTIGRGEYLAGHMQKAIQSLEQARAAGDRSNELFFMLGNSYLQTHQVPKGRAAFAELYGVPPDSGAAHLFTAHMLIRLELEDDAQAELEAALAREPKIPEAHFMLGEIAIYRAQFDRAVDELGHEIALNPAFAMAYYRLGDAYTRREDWERAVPPLQRAVWLDPTYSGPYILLGKTYLKKGDLSEAESMLRRALRMDPKNASAHYLLGRTLIQSGHAEEGKKLLQRWEELRTESGQ